MKNLLFSFWDHYQRRSNCCFFPLLRNLWRRFFSKDEANPGFRPYMRSMHGLHLKLWSMHLSFGNSRKCISPNMKQSSFFSTSMYTYTSMYTIRRIGMRIRRHMSSTEIYLFLSPHSTSTSTSLYTYTSTYMYTYTSTNMYTSIHIHTPHRSISTSASTLRVLCNLPLHLPPDRSAPVFKIISITMWRFSQSDDTMHWGRLDWWV